MNNIGEIMGALGALLTVIGGGVAWIWRELKSFKAETRKDLDECRKREQRDTERRALEQERRGLHRVVIELFWQELRRVAPESPVLARAQKVMTELDSKDEEIAAKDAEPLISDSDA